jgi:hypothetical protein
VPELVATLADFGVFGQDTVHRAFRAEIPALIERGCVDLGGRAVHESLAVEKIKNPAALCAIDATYAGSASRGVRTRPCAASPVVRRARDC